jgi:hypothetical protein
VTKTNHFDRRDRRPGITRGSIVSKKADPVHTGRVTQLNITDGKVFAQVRWFGLDCVESRIPEGDLQVTEEWK